VIKNKIKFFIFLTFILYQNFAYSKTSTDNDFNPRYLSNYLSAIISYNNENNSSSVKFFDASKNLINKHENYLKDYIFALVLNGEVEKALYQIKSTKNQQLKNFFEADLLLILDNFKKKKFKKNDLLLNKLKKHNELNNYNQLIYKTLSEYNQLFQKNKIPKDNNLGKLSLINNAFIYCYLNDQETSSKFLEIIESEEGGYSRYLFFYINYLINNNQIENAIKLAEKIELIGSNLIIAQTKFWMQNSEFNKIKNLFSCQKETDILSEFFYLISNLFSVSQEYEKSNFYGYLSTYLNTQFNYNYVQIVENYFDTNKLDNAKLLLGKIDDNDKIYNWFKLKKLSQIISENNSDEEALVFIEKKFNNYKNPPVNILLDMGNIYKRNNKFKKSIKIYSNVLDQLDQNSNIYAEILYRRGGSYERIGEHLKSDEDLIKSLNIRPNDPYVMNYLAYGWLDRNYKIEDAINMLEKAYKQKVDDPYIIDSVGWGYFLTNNYVSAEKYLQRALRLMPRDPIVNDHYGDVLWKLNRKIQARYYWQSAFESDYADDELKNKISEKLLKGL
jgi:tetratricopeptide (TPR) repeat protein